MQNIVINMCEKFHYDRLRNDRALGNRKSDNNPRTATITKRTTFVAIGDPFPGPKIIHEDNVRTVRYFALLVTDAKPIIDYWARAAVCTGWLSGVVVRTSGSWSTDREFDTRPVQCRVA